VNYYQFIILFFTVIISGSIILFVKINNKTLKLILSFSGAYLFAISVLHLIPEIYKDSSSNVGIYILIGFFAQILMEFFTEGIEHGHIHVHSHNHKHHVFPFAMMAGLSIHSFLEGMPLADSSTGAHQQLLLGIVFHNIPIAMALMSMLLQSHVKKSLAITCLVVFALITPLGTFTSYVIGENMIGNFSIYFDRIMAVVVGIFLHISTTILFEASENHRFNFIKFIVIILGASLAFIHIE